MPLNLSEADSKKLKADIERWRLDPVAFVIEVFGPGYESAHGAPLVLDGWQKNFLQALVGPKRRVAAKACKGPGKTAALAWAGWWFLTTRQHPKGAATSITGDNLDDGLWTELAMWQSYSPLLIALFEHKSESIESRDHPKTWFLSKRTFRQDADKTKQAETLAGLHAAAIFLLLDEVGSYPDGVFGAADAIFNVEGVDGLIAAAGNATSIDGPLYKICTEDADKWHVEEITGDPEDPNRSSRLDMNEARAAIAKHGREDPVVMVNWLGKFPPRSGNRLLGPDDISLAERRNPPARLWHQEAKVWGLDVAGEGLDPDDAVLYPRQGPVAFTPRTWRNKKTDDLADEVATLYQEAVRDEERGKGQAPLKIFVDRTGLGRGTYDRLRSLLGNDLIIGVDFGSRASDETQYDDKATEMYCLLSEWVRDCGALPSGRPNLRRDLTSRAINTVTTKGKTRRKIESKKLLKKRGLPSPDEGDALALTFAAPVFPRRMNDVAGRHSAKARTDFNGYDALRR